MSAALPLLHSPGVSEEFLIGHVACMVWRENEALLLFTLWQVSRDFFSGFVSTILEWAIESVLGSDGWGQMRRKIPITLGKCWTKSRWENYKSSWSELAVFLPPCDLVIARQLAAASTGQGSVGYFYMKALAFWAS